MRGPRLLMSMTPKNISLLCGELTERRLENPPTCRDKGFNNFGNFIASRGKNGVDSRKTGLDVDDLLEMFGAGLTPAEVLGIVALRFSGSAVLR